MTIVEGEIHERQLRQLPTVEDSAVRLELEGEVARVVLTGVLTAALSAAAREVVLEAADLMTAAVVLDLRVALDPTDPEVLPHLVDVAERRCWAARCRFDVTTSSPAVHQALETTGIW